MVFNLGSNGLSDPRKLNPHSRHALSSIEHSTLYTSLKAWLNARLCCEVKRSVNQTAASADRRPRQLVRVHANSSDERPVHVEGDQQRRGGGGGGGVSHLACVQPRREQASASEEARRHAQAEGVRAAAATRFWGNPANFEKFSQKTERSKGKK